MRAWIATTTLTLLAVPAAWAGNVPDRPTFNRDVLPILQANCQECHRAKPINISGMVAPFALTSYEAARPWAKSISKAVTSRKMPPWAATTDFHGIFRNERSLTDDEIGTIARWVEMGAVRGLEEDAPAPLEFADTEWWLGEPDLVVSLPEPVWVNDDVVDWQPNIYIELTEEMLPENRFLRAVECQPGSVGVHHIVLSAMPPGADTGSLSAAAGGKALGGLAPGSEPSMALDGFGILLDKGSTLRVNMHYNKEAGPGTGFWDQSKIGFFFYPEDQVVQEVKGDALGTLDFEVPPGHPNWTVGVARTFERPFSVLSYLPHMHVRGVAAEYVAYLPGGRVQRLLDVPQYDYDWQTQYEYPEPYSFPAGTRIEVELTFDNSTNNTSNPDPSKAVGFGLETQDEMAFGFLSYVWNDDDAVLATGAGGR